MRPITRLHSRTAVLPDENIDTDRIIPARFLTTTERAGLGKLCFNDWRYQADGSDNLDGKQGCLTCSGPGGSPGRPRKQLPRSKKPG